MIVQIESKHCTEIFFLKSGLRLTTFGKLKTLIVVFLIKNVKCILIQKHKMSIPKEVTARLGFEGANLIVTQEHISDVTIIKIELSQWGKDGSKIKSFKMNINKLQTEATTSIFCPFVCI